MTLDAHHEAVLVGRDDVGAAAGGAIDASSVAGNVAAAAATLWSDGRRRHCATWCATFKMMCWRGREAGHADAAAQAVDGEVSGPTRPGVLPGSRSVRRQSGPVRFKIPAVPQ